MATATIENLKARCEAIGYVLHVTTEGTQLVIDENAERSAVEVIFIHESDIDDKLEDWLADREQVSARVRQEARGLVPAPGTTDGENGLYVQPTLRERRAAILKTADAQKAIGEASSTLLSIHGMGRLLQQDTLRGEDEWVIAIAHMLVEETDRMIEFLDRKGGWQSGAA